VPPGGAAFDVPVHAGEVCILSFPGEKLTGSAITSSLEFEVRGWGTDGVAVRASGKAPSATIALGTAAGVKVNVTIRVVPAGQNALTLVRFKASTAEEALEARVVAEVAKRMTPMQAELAATKRDIEARVRERSDVLLAERLLKRTEVVQLNAHERNDDNVIAHVERALMIGDDGYLYFDLENRGNAPFRLARVTVMVRERSLAGPARLLSSAIDKDPSVLGVVPAGTTAHGIVTVRGADKARGQDLTLELADPTGERTIRLTRGLVLK
jgi:hypothetical protein